MAFCTECGARLSDGAKFCANCGTAVAVFPLPNENIGTKTINTSLERIYYCPDCHSAVTRLDAICPYCGTLIPNREASTSVQRFAQQLYKIDAEDSYKNSNFGMNKVMKQESESKAANRKISLISAFPIPNTIEEISEFVILAANSIDVRWGRNTLQNRMFGGPGSSCYTNIKLADTWINKLNQAYDKAKISFHPDPMFHNIEKIYTEKMKELNRKISD